ncbi:hypothetical protein P8452_60764 [Trifolium repens]|nr:hypothetical protein P8452_60764 [Trifolium repens]
MKENQLSQILDARVQKEAGKDVILTISNLTMRCLRLNGKKRPTMRGVSAELETLRKAQSTLQINHDHDESPSSDEQSFGHTTNETDQESRDESIPLYLQIESTYSGMIIKCG